MPVTPSGEDAPLPGDVSRSLAERGVEAQDEISLLAPTRAMRAGIQPLPRTPAATKRWKCRYRLLLAAGYFDGQSAAEAYGRALLAALTPATTDAPTPQEPPRR